MVWTELEMKICFLKQSWTKVCRQILEIKQKMFYDRMFYSLIFLQIFTKKRQDLSFGWLAG